MSLALVAAPAMAGSLDGGRATGGEAVAIGPDAVAAGGWATSLGHLSNAASQSSTALGSHTEATGWKATALGHGSAAVGEHALAIGINNSSAAERATSLGIVSSATARSAMALGDQAQAKGISSIAAGTQAMAAGSGSIALGAAAEASAANSIALGNQSAASRGAQKGYDAAFVGASDSKGELNLGQRTITGVASGMATDDAVNVSQLRGGVDHAIQTAKVYTDVAAVEGKRYTDAGVTDAKRYTDAGVADAKRHTDAAAAEGKRYTDAGVAGAIAHTDQGLARVDSDVSRLRKGADGVFRVSQDDASGAQATGMQSTAGGAGARAIGRQATALGHGALASGQNSVALGADSRAERDNSVAVGAAGRERVIAHVADGSAPSDAATVRQLAKVRDSAVHYEHNGDQVDYTAVTLGQGTPVALRNVAPGVKGTDAVNLAQLQDTSQRTLDSAQAYTDARVAPVQNDLWRLGERVDELKRDTEAGIAAAMGLKQAPAVSGRTTYYAGVGGYRSQAALGVSLRRTADNGRWSLEGGVSGNRQGLGGYVGISGALGD